MMERGPIFLGGIDRSGKTLLRLMLETHPNIAMTRRLNLWFYFYNRYGDLGQAKNFERCLGTMVTYKHVAHLRPDVERVRREFWEGEPSYARLFALLQRHYAEGEGKARWGDQTGLVERYAGPIFAAYPGAQMIQMLRDPRDRYEAARARHARGHGQVGRSTAMWLYSAGLAAQNQRRYPERYLVVRYEDLVTQPEATLRAVCAFLDEPFDPVMLTMAGAKGVPEPKGPLSPAQIGRYREGMGARELAFMQLHAGRAMRTWDYPPEPLRLAPGERLRFALADWPAHLVRMVGWRAREAAQHHAQAQIGRRPGPKRAVTRQSVSGAG